MNYPQQGFPPAQQFPPAQPQFQQPQAQPSYPAPGPYQQQFPAAQPQYAPPPQQPAGPPAPVIRGTLADAYSQGARAAGHGKAMKLAYPGAALAGYVARDLTDLDTSAETDFKTKQPIPDGRGGYKIQIIIPVNVQPTQEYPEGKATIWAKGRLKTAVVHAMVAAGYDINAGESLREGDLIQIQRAADVPTNQGNAAHDFVVQVTRNSGGNPTAPAATTTPTAAPAAASPYPTTPPAASPAPSSYPPGLPDVQAQYQQAAQQVFEQPAFQQPAQQFAPVPPTMPATPMAPAQPAAPTGFAPTAPAPAPAANGQPGLDPYQDALVKQITGQQLTPQEAQILAAGPPQR